MCECSYLKPSTTLVLPGVYHVQITKALADTVGGFTFQCLLDYGGQVCVYLCPLWTNRLLFKITIYSESSSKQMVMFHSYFGLPEGI